MDTEMPGPGSEEEEEEEEEGGEDEYWMKWMREVEETGSEQDTHRGGEGRKERERGQTDLAR
jgi:hypothetical protein